MGFQKLKIVALLVLFIALIKPIEAISQTVMTPKIGLVSSSFIEHKDNCQDYKNGYSTMVFYYGLTIGKYVSKSTRINIGINKLSNAKKGGINVCNPHRDIIEIQYDFLNFDLGIDYEFRKFIIGIDASILLNYNTSAYILGGYGDYHEDLTNYVNNKTFGINFSLSYNVWNNLLIFTNFNKSITSYTTGIKVNWLKFGIAYQIEI